MHIMLDLETGGTTPGSIIRSIGACVFDPWGSAWANSVTPSFYCNVDEQSCRAIGMVSDAKTTKWWQEQSDEAKAALLVNPLPIERALRAFEQFWHDVHGRWVWSYGANFDVVLMEAAMRMATAAHAFEAAAAGEQKASFEAVSPWSYRDVRCVRTTLALAGMDLSSVKPAGVLHNALDDCRTQVTALASAFQALRIKPFGGVFPDGQTQETRRISAGADAPPGDPDAG